MHIHMHMDEPLAKSYRTALELVSLADLAVWSGRAYRTLQAYRRGERRITEAAVRELTEYLRLRSEAFTAAADALAAALTQEEDGA